MTVRLTASVLVLVVGTAGCSQGGSEATAAEAADEFLSALVRGDTDDAWSHFTPETKQVIYDNDKAEFIRDVGNADWSRLRWQMGAVTDYDISWGVHVAVEAASVPAFLVDRRIVGGSPDIEKIVLLVQVPGDPGDYLIAAQGLDIDLR